MIIRGGENIYPREIEDFLYSHPKVQSVQVFGVPDPQYGEQVCCLDQVADGRERCHVEEIVEFAAVKSRITKCRATLSSSRSSR